MAAYRDATTVDRPGATVLLRALVIIVIVGLLLGVVTLTEVGAVLQVVWDWVVQTVTALVDRLSR